MDGTAISQVNNILDNPAESIMRMFIMTIGEFTVFYRELNGCKQQLMRNIGKVIGPIRLAICSETFHVPRLSTYTTLSIIHNFFEIQSPGVEIKHKAVEATFNTDRDTTARVAIILSCTE